jgi:transcriptional regulator with XRE-family HTH domain
MMKKNNIAMEYNSTEIDEILGLISDEEQEKIDMKMRLAAKISDAIKAKGIKKGELARLLRQKNQSVVTKWLSGTHNFTSDTLFDLQKVLEIDLINLDDKKSSEEIVTVIHIHVKNSQDIPATISSMKAGSTGQGTLKFKTQQGSFSKMQITA